uniref:Uncharacterized protein n=1 Tax=viral metagenome TaxID=1070528 RepID=A0A6C0CMR6_9ZZZZ
MSDNSLQIASVVMCSIILALILLAAYFMWRQWNSFRNLLHIKPKRSNI